jgi:hypothetical protein
MDNREIPWAEHEKVYLLAEMIKAAQVPSHVLFNFIRESQVQPRWNDMALPPGKSCYDTPRPWQMHANRAMIIDCTATRTFDSLKSNGLRQSGRELCPIPAPTNARRGCSSYHVHGSRSLQETLAPRKRHARRSSATASTAAKLPWRLHPSRPCLCIRHDDANRRACEQEEARETHQGGGAAKGARGGCARRGLPATASRKSLNHGATRTIASRLRVSSSRTYTPAIRPRSHDVYNDPSATNTAR